MIRGIFELLHVKNLRSHNITAFTFELFFDPSTQPYCSISLISLEIELCYGVVFCGTDPYISGTSQCSGEQLGIFRCWNRLTHFARTPVSKKCNYFQAFYRIVVLSKNKFSFQFMLVLEFYWVKQHSRYENYSFPKISKLLNGHVHGKLKKMWWNIIPSMCLKTAGELKLQPQIGGLATKCIKQIPRKIIDLLVTCFTPKQFTTYN